MTKNILSKGIAHEINNPLTVIQARAFQLHQMVESGELNSDKLKQIADSIHGASTKISEILRTHKEQSEGSGS